MANYSDKLKSPKWQKKRLEILQLHNFKCDICGKDYLELHVHHIKYTLNKDVWDYPDENFKVLCYKCHEDEHDRISLEFRNSRMKLPEYEKMSLKQALTGKP